MCVRFCTQKIAFTLECIFVNHALCIFLPKNSRLVLEFIFFLNSALCLFLRTKIPEWARHSFQYRYTSRFVRASRPKGPPHAFQYRSNFNGRS